MKKLIVLLDNGHGKETVGKRSPNGEFKEYEFCREVVAGIEGKLKDNPKFEVIKITPEECDIPLGTRVKRINNYCSKYGAGNCVMISVHVNASGNGVLWMKAKGWQCHTTRKLNTSDVLADCLYDAAKEVLPKDRKIREYSPTHRNYENDYYVIKGANCPAVLTENFFMDNLDDYEYLMSSRALNDIINLHIRGAELYYENHFKKN